MIYQSINWLDSAKEVLTVTLPNVTSGAATGPGGAAQNTRLHIFAVSLVAATGSGVSLEIQQARSTQLWFEGTNKTQIFEAVIVNTGNDWILANHSVKVTVEASGITTVQPGIINRLRPGDRATVRIGVVNSKGTQPGTKGKATLRITGRGVQTDSSFDATFGIAAYEATYESIYSHESPPWYTGGKYGIFIHWGVYAVPGWGDSGKRGERYT
jgi:alpha-L-fucosidase